MTSANILLAPGQSWPEGCDLYLHWAALTNFRHVEGTSSHTDDPHHLEVLVECSGALRDELGAIASNPQQATQASGVSAHHLFDATPDGSKGVFSVSASKKTLRSWLNERRSEWTRLELSSARKAPGLAPSPVGDSTGAGRHSKRQSVEFPQKISDKPVVMAVIDDGLPFLNERFRVAGNPSQTRIRYFWDQTAKQPPVPTATGWQSVYRFGYGRELTANQINVLISAPGTEAERYAQLDYERALPRLTHGSHVADLAAGGPDADDIPLIMVQLPGPVVQDTSGGGTSKHVADAILYILERVGDDTSVVINLSFGTNAGPHDGSSLLERAMDAISLAEQNKRGFLMVLPAGNAFQSQGHGQLTLPSGQTGELVWNVRFDDPTDTFCELWWPTDKWKDLRVCLIDPSGNPMKWKPSTAPVTRTDGSAVVSAILGTPRSAHANQKAHVLIALAPTQASGQAPRAQPGLWRIRLENVGQADLTVNAWIQRDDSPMNTVGSVRQSFFLSTRGALTDDQLDVLADPVKRMGTGNSLAHGTETVVVGGIVKASGLLAPYTAAATTAGNWPDALAVCEDAAEQPGVEASGTRSGEIYRLNGTSVAAPQVARLVAKLWARGHREKSKQAVLKAIYGKANPSAQPSEVTRARYGAGRLPPSREA